MPADVVPETSIPGLACQVTPAMQNVLQLLQRRGFVQKGRNTNGLTLDYLTRMAQLGLVDAGSDPIDEVPFVWVRNHNGEQVLRYLEELTQGPGPRFKINSLATIALNSLRDIEQVEVFAVLDALMMRDPALWSSEEVIPLAGGTPKFLTRISPELRAFIELGADGTLELTGIMREDTLRILQERVHLGSAVG